MALIICLSVLLIISILLFSFCPLIKKAIYKKRFLFIYGKKVYKLAYKKDYYLINNIKIKADDDQFLHIDHLLFGDKYVYLIKDYYFDGGLSLNNKDASWIFYYGNSKKPKQKYVKNPMNDNDKRINKFCQLTGLDKSLFISIILINNDCVIVSQNNDSDNNFVTKIKDLENLVSNIENRDVALLNEINLKYAVKDINKLNLNRKK
ncbi:MAG TPA: hypothetical protein DDW20_04515 [Firmicutes bacterium]|nr:hypothetical protein [Bacillota bacterium]